MPGELESESESQNVGWYERRYSPNNEWMVDGYGSVQKWKDHNKGKSTQMQRIMKRLKKQKDK